MLKTIHSSSHTISKFIDRGFQHSPSRQFEETTTDTASRIFDHPVCSSPTPLMIQEEIGPRERTVSQIVIMLSYYSLIH